MAGIAKDEADIIHESVPTRDQMNEINKEMFSPNYNLPNRPNGRRPGGKGGGKKGRGDRGDRNDDGQPDPNDRLLI